MLQAKREEARGGNRDETVGQVSYRKPYGIGPQEADILCLIGQAVYGVRARSSHRGVEKRGLKESNFPLPFGVRANVQVLPFPPPFPLSGVLFYRNRHWHTRTLAAILRGGEGRKGSECHLKEEKTKG